MPSHVYITASELAFTYTAVLTTPKIINSSDSEVCASINDSVKIYCSFNASTMDGVTIVVWLKDHSVISGYDNETRPVQGKDNVIISSLNIVNLTDHQGKYTCYCYYNQNIVTSNKLFSSDQATVNVQTDCATGKGKKSKDKPLLELYMCSYITSYFNREQYSMDMGDHNQWCCNSTFNIITCHTCSDICETKK